MEQPSGSQGENVVLVDLVKDTTPPPHRSHDPSNNLKQSDPFQFGSRFLSEEDNVFEFNAWDHVETDDAYKEYAETQYAKQREAPVSEFDKSMSTPFSCFCSRFSCNLMIQSMYSSSEVY